MRIIIYCLRKPSGYISVIYYFHEKFSKHHGSRKSTDTSDEQFVHIRSYAQGLERFPDI